MMIPSTLPLLSNSLDLYIQESEQFLEKEQVHSTLASDQTDKIAAEIFKSFTPSNVSFEPEKKAAIENVPNKKGHKRNWGSYTSDEFSDMDKDEESTFGETTLDDHTQELQISPYTASKLGLEPDADEDDNELEIPPSPAHKKLPLAAISPTGHESPIDTIFGEKIIQICDQDFIKSRILKMFQKAESTEHVIVPKVRDWMAERAALCNFVTVKHLFVHEKPPRAPLIKKMNPKIPEQTLTSFVWSNKHVLLHDHGLKTEYLDDLHSSLKELFHDLNNALYHVIQVQNSELWNDLDFEDLNEDLSDFIATIQVFHNQLSSAFFSIPIASDSQEDEKDVDDETLCRRKCQKAEQMLLDLLIDLKCAREDLEQFNLQLDQVSKKSYVPKLEALKNFKAQSDYFSGQLTYFDSLFDKL